MEIKREAVVSQMDTDSSTGMDTVGEVVRRRVVTVDIIYQEIVVCTMDTDEVPESDKPEAVI